MKSSPSNARKLVLFVALGGAVALLLWLKLRMVTDVPRTAYADPKATKGVQGK